MASSETEASYFTEQTMDVTRLALKIRLMRDPRKDGN